MVKDHIQQYNYTLNPEGIFNAIKYMYTYYPDPNNRSHIREEFINVSRVALNLMGQCLCKMMIFTTCGLRGQHNKQLINDNAKVIQHQPRSC